MLATGVASSGMRFHADKSSCRVGGGAGTVCISDGLIRSSFCNRSRGPEFRSGFVVGDR